MFTFGETVKEGLKWICLCLSNTILLPCSGFLVLTPPFTLHHLWLTTLSHISPDPKFNKASGVKWDWHSLVRLSWAACSVYVNSLS